MRESLEERACDLAVYIIENQTTVRAAAKKFGVSKSTVHTDFSELLNHEHRSSFLYLPDHTQRNILAGI